MTISMTSPYWVARADAMLNYHLDDQDGGPKTITSYSDYDVLVTIESKNDTIYRRDNLLSATIHVDIRAFHPAVIRIIASDTQTFRRSSLVSVARDWIARVCEKAAFIARDRERIEALMGDIGIHNIPKRLWDDHPNLVDGYGTRFEETVKMLRVIRFYDSEVATS